MMKHISLSRFLLPGILTLGAILIFSCVAYAKQDISDQDISNTIKQPSMVISDINKTTLDLDALELGGNKLENTSIIAGISPEQAVKFASNYRSDYASESTDITVEYYQITNKTTNIFSDNVKKTNKYLSDNGFLKEAPCYIVSFKGITRIGHAPANSKPPIFNEYHVVIDANSGEVLYSFAYADVE